MQIVHSRLVSGIEKSCQGKCFKEVQTTAAEERYEQPSHPIVGQNWPIAEISTIRKKMLKVEMNL